MLYRCFLVAKIAWRLAAWVGDAWWPFDHPFFCSCLDQSDSFKRETWRTDHPCGCPKMTSNFFPEKLVIPGVVGPCWSSNLIILLI